MPGSPPPGKDCCSRKSQPLPSAGVREVQREQHLRRRLDTAPRTQRPPGDLEGHSGTTGPSLTGTMPVPVSAGACGDTSGTYFTSLKIGCHFCHHRKEPYCKGVLSRDPRTPGRPPTPGIPGACKYAHDSRVEFAALINFPERFVTTTKKVPPLPRRF